eukprot:TRINITY_DN3481_c0_g1_i1.p1 TRINITY_DN3481_c0_g1~~TRINITY_DN3481_c0_g1_i1.p1  ORF type:complete len:675 (+),score=141.98 TRINITY_DN3481_c0_g1_i1:71-2095(+)
MIPFSIIQEEESKSFVDILKKLKKETCLIMKQQLILELVMSNLDWDICYNNYGNELLCILYELIDITPSLTTLIITLLMKTSVNDNIIYIISSNELFLVKLFDYLMTLSNDIALIDLCNLFILKLCYKKEISEMIFKLPNCSTYLINIFAISNHNINSLNTLLKIFEYGISYTNTSILLLENKELFKSFLKLLEMNNLTLSLNVYKVFEACISNKYFVSSNLCEILLQHCVSCLIYERELDKKIIKSNLWIIWCLSAETVILKKLSQNYQFLDLILNSVDTMNLEISLYCIGILINLTSKTELCVELIERNQQKFGLVISKQIIEMFNISTINQMVQLFVNLSVTSLGRNLLNFPKFFETFGKLLSILYKSETHKKSKEFLKCIKLLHTLSSDPYLHQQCFSPLLRSFYDTILSDWCTDCSNYKPNDLDFIILNILIAILNALSHNPDVLIKFNRLPHLLDSLTFSFPFICQMKTNQLVSTQSVKDCKRRIGQLLFNMSSDPMTINLLIEHPKLLKSILDNFELLDLHVIDLIFSTLQNVTAESNGAKRLSSHDVINLLTKNYLFLPANNENIAAKTAGILHNIVFFFPNCSAYLIDPSFFDNISIIFCQRNLSSLLVQNLLCLCCVIVQNIELNERIFQNSKFSNFKNSINFVVHFGVGDIKKYAQVIQSALD